MRNQADKEKGKHPLAGEKKKGGENGRGKWEGKKEEGGGLLAC